MNYFLNDTEDIISSLWSKILNTDDIDVESNFFDAGGTSLNIKQLAFEIENELKIKTITGTAVIMIDASIGDVKLKP